MIHERHRGKLQHIRLRADFNALQLLQIDESKKTKENIHLGFVQQTLLWQIGFINQNPSKS